MQTEQNPLILTLQLDAKSQAFFDEQRERYFPPERNFLKAHLTLFHQLPDNEATRYYFKNITFTPFELQVTGLMNLGGGVAYSLNSPELSGLHWQISTHFENRLIPQDKQALRPHVVIQNKVKPEAARQLFATLEHAFEPFTVQAMGLTLWRYLGGAWEFVDHFN